MSRIIGTRVIAWFGPRDGQRGVIIRVNGRTRMLIQWDDDTEDWYSSADVYHDENQDTEVAKT